MEKHRGALIVLREKIEEYDAIKTRYKLRRPKGLKEEIECIKADIPKELLEKTGLEELWKSLKK